MTSRSLNTDAPHSASPAPRLRRDPVSTALAIAGLIAVAAIHLGQVVPTVKQTPYLGTSFVLLVVACVVLAGCLLVSDRQEVWLLVATVNAMTIGGYVFTRTVSSFFDNQDVGNWSETLGIIAILVEAVLILLSLESVYGNRLGRMGLLRAESANPGTVAPAISRSHALGRSH